MDLTETIAPKSDQLNADDLMSGPVTVTISEVTKGSAEQPVDIHLVEFPGRAYRPSKSMRRVMVTAWGKEASAYAGHKLTLYRDPDVRFGKDLVGGIKISHMSNLEKRLTLALTISRGKRSPHIVEPLVEAAPAPTEPTAEHVAACDDTAALRGMWQSSGPERRKQIEARVAELTTETDSPADDHENAQWDSPADSLPIDGEVQG